jgi:hypothetical protein
MPMCGLSTTIRGETSRHQSERDFPHLVELPLPSGGFRGQLSEFNAFHRERRLQAPRGRGRNEAEQFYVRFCFADPATADAFRDRFGGTRMTYTPERARTRFPGRA